MSEVTPSTTNVHSNVRFYFRLICPILTLIFAIVGGVLVGISGCVTYYPNFCMS